MLQNQEADVIEEDRLEDTESSQDDRNQPIQQNQAQQEQIIQNQDQQVNIGAQQQSPLQTGRAIQHRLSFSPPFPVQTGTTSGITLAPQSPLTNHEIYELIQKTQQQAVGGQLNQMVPVSGISTGSFKQPKRGQSLYVQKNRLERQGSVIVGTPGFRERYGK